MPGWITAVVVPVGCVAITLAAQFYFKWVPDVDQQKRHVKHVAGWASDILSIGLLGFCTYVQCRKGLPVTPAVVVGISLSITILVVGVLSIAATRILGRLVQRSSSHFDRALDNADKHINNAGRHIAITGAHREALLVLAEDPSLSAATAQRLRAILSPQSQLARPAEE